MIFHASDEPPVVLDEELDGVRHLWRCEPPSLCQQYRVTHDEWHDDTRTIYAWEAA